MSSPPSCPDGSAGLTREIYEGNDPAAYAGVTCIPACGFWNYTEDVVLTGTGLDSLISIEQSAFWSLKGKLDIRGEYPSLEMVGAQAFRDAGTADSSIAFGSLPLLQMIASQAFAGFAAR